MEINGIQSMVSSFGRMQNNCGPCKPKQVPSQTPSYNGVIIVENPKTQRALRTACRIIAADMYEKSKRS